MHNPTRGTGLLEGFLARQRYKKAMSLIPEHYHGGKVLDIGCSAHPFFLARSPFSEKYGIDRIIDGSAREKYLLENIVLDNLDLEGEVKLQFGDNFFSVVTMLAVVEHIEPLKIVPLFAEVLRTLEPGGIFILTTPASWTGGVLFAMKMLGLVSREEIDEHKDSYSPADLRNYLTGGGFRNKDVETGYFECFMNIFVRAGKPLVENAE